MEQENQEKTLANNLPNDDIDRRFHKVSIQQFKQTLKPVCNQQMNLVLWILNEMKKNELHNISYQEIAEKSETSYQTVVRTIQSLSKTNFLRKNGKNLMVNPDIIYKGRLSDRITLRKAYNGENVEDERYLFRLYEKINNLKEEAKRIEEKLGKEKTSLSEQEKRELSADLTTSKEAEQRLKAKEEIIEQEYHMYKKHMDEKTYLQSLSEELKRKEMSEKRNAQKNDVSAKTSDAES